MSFGKKFHRQISRNSFGSTVCASFFFYPSPRAARRRATLPFFLLGFSFLNFPPAGVIFADGRRSNINSKLQTRQASQTDRQDRQETTRPDRPDRPPLGKDKDTPKPLQKVPGPDLPKTSPQAMLNDLWGAFLVDRLGWETPGGPGGVGKVFPRPSPDQKLLKSPRRPPETT